MKRFLALAGLLVATNALAGARITIRNIDLPGVGLNDPTPVAPVGGNPGVTLGDQRFIALQTAANIWGRLIDSSVEIVIDVRMRSLTCDASSGVLAQCGPKRVVSNFSGSPKQDVWYPIALANKLANRDLTPGESDMAADFNVDVDNDTCLGTIKWYYGLDDKHGDDVDIMTTALHEFAHGLGIAGTYNSTTGALFQGKPNIFEVHTLDDSVGLRWDQMTDAQRLASQTNDQNLVWDGAASRFAASRFLGPEPFLRVNAPASVASTYTVRHAGFGAAIGVGGLTGTVVAAIDESNDTGVFTTDACTAITNPAAIIGRIALADRGNCRFLVKAKNLQDAGAIAAILVDNVVSSSPPPIGGGAADGSITIPVVSVTKATGDAIRAQLSNGVLATIAADPARLAGTDSNGFVKLYAPSPFNGGSSVHHWDTSASPGLLMEPSITGDLTHDVDVTIDQLIDMGWTEPPTGRRTLHRGN